MNAIEILTAARDRNSWTEDAFEALKRDISTLEGMKYDITAERVASSSTDSSLCAAIASYGEHLDYLIDQIKLSKSAVKAAENIIRGIHNPRWQQVLTCRYINQMGWLEVAERMGTTDDGARMMCARALENLTR